MGRANPAPGEAILASRKNPGKIPFLVIELTLPPFFMFFPDK
jgi:hypothetical protein